MAKTPRPDKSGTHRAQFDINARKIYATQKICAICGQPVDFSLKWPDPMCKTIDHIIPVSKGGHPSALENLQLAHFHCNRQKADHIAGEDPNKKNKNKTGEPISNRVLPQTRNWLAYKAG